MPRKFFCEKCNKEIIVQYLKTGETAKCKWCNAEVIVPENAIEIPQSQIVDNINSSNNNPSKTISYKTKDLSIYYSKLRLFFIVGCILGVLSMILPIIKKEIANEKGYSLGGAGKPYELTGIEFTTNYSYTQDGFTTRRGMFILRSLISVSLFIATIVYLVLAIVHQKRWVFISGSCLVLFIVLDIFIPTFLMYYNRSVYILLEILESLLISCGFFTMPPKEIIKEAISK